MLTHFGYVKGRLEAGGAFAAHKLSSILCCGKDSAVFAVVLRRAWHDRHTQLAVVVDKPPKQLQQLFGHVLGQWLVWSKAVDVYVTPLGLPATVIQ